MCLAIPGKLIYIDDEDPFFKIGKVDFGGVIKEVSLALLPKARIGNYVYVHAGIAISKVNAKEADRIFRIIKDLENYPDYYDHEIFNRI